MRTVGPYRAGRPSGAEPAGRPAGRRRRVATAAAAAAVVAGALLAAGAARPSARPAARIDATRTASATRLVALAPARTGPLPSVGAGRPVDWDDVGDPFILSVPAAGDRARYWVLFYTTDWQSNVPTAVSSDLVHWHRIADALPVLPVWAVDSRTMTWAPSAQRVPGGWALYFSTEDAANHRECIGAGFATSPVGPYTDRSRRPLVCQSALGGSIDPSVVAEGGHSALVWKSDGSETGVPVALWSQQLGPDGLATTGRPHRLLVADRAWQRGNVEGPAMLADRHGGWWLFYSGGSWLSTTYDTGVAWCPTPAGPCREAASGPLLAGSVHAVSPGGLDTFTGPGGALWASWSAFPSDPANAQAAMAEDRVLEIAPVRSH